MHNLRPTSCLFLETIAGLDGQGAGPMHHLEQSHIETKMSGLPIYFCLHALNLAVRWSFSRWGPKENSFYMIWGVTGPSCFPHKRAFPTSEGPYPKVANLPLI